MTTRDILMAAAGGDSTPDAFDFVNITGANPSTVISSSTLTITGITGAVLVSSTGGVLFSINGDTFSSTQRVILAGQTLQLQLTTGSGFSTAYSGSITVGDTTDSWSVTTRAADTTPDAFAFTDVTGAERSTVTTSNTVTITGLEPNFSITVSASGGTVDAGTSALSGTFAASKVVTASGTGTLVVAARITSSASFNTNVNCIITIGSVSDTFAVATRVADTTPDAFAFTDVTGAERSTVTTSNTVTITGLEPNFLTTVSASGGTILAGTSTLSGSYSASQQVTASATGTIVVSARVTSSSSFFTTVNCTVTIGGVSDIFSVQTRSLDGNPDSFVFTDVTGAEINTVFTSNTVTVTGLEPNHSSFTITATGGTIDAGTSALSGTFAASKVVTTSGTGTLVLAARVTSSGSFSTSVNCDVSVGGGGDQFRVTTRAADTTPTAYTITATNGVERSTVTTSGTVTVSGLEPNFSITVSASGGTVDAGTSALSGTFAASKTVTTSGTGTLVVAARGTSSASFSTTVTVNITVGSGSATPYNITTRAVDTIPAAFSFTDVTNAAVSTQFTSNTVTVSGLEPSTAISISASGGSFDAGASALTGTFYVSGPFTTSASGTLVIAARVTSSASFSTATNCTVTIGTGSDTYTVTTRAADTTPTAFSFTDVSGAQLSTVTTSNTVTVSGLEPNFSITVSASGGNVDAGTSALSGTFAASKTVTTSGTGTLVVAARVTSGANFNTVANCTVTIGTVSDIYTVTTRAADTTPNAFSFTDVSGAQLSTVTTSGTVTVSGLEPNFSITVSASGGTVDAGTSALSGTFAASKTVTTSGTGTLVVAARVTSSSSYNTATNCTVTVGSVSDTFTVTTTSGTIPTAYAFTNVTNAEPNTQYTSNTLTITGLGANLLIPITVTYGLGSGQIAVGTTTLGAFAGGNTSVTTSAGGTFVMALRGTSGPAGGGSSSIITQVGDDSARAWTVTTRAADTTPSAFSFANETNAALSTTYTSTITVTGLEPNFNANITCSGGLIDAGSPSLSGTFATSKSVTTSAGGTFVLAARLTSSASFNTAVTNTVTVNSTNGTYTVTTRDADIIPEWPATTYTNVAINTSTAGTSTFTIGGLEPSTQYTLAVVGIRTTGATVDVGTTALSGTRAASKTFTTSASGTFVYRLFAGTGTAYFNDGYRVAGIITRTGTGGNSVSPGHEFITPFDWANVSGFNPTQPNTVPGGGVTATAGSLVTFAVRYSSTNSPPVEWIFSGNAYDVVGQVSLDNSTWVTGLVQKTATAGENFTVYFRTTAPAAGQVKTPTFYAANNNRGVSWVVYGWQITGS